MGLLLQVALKGRMEEEVVVIHFLTRFQLLVLLKKIVLKAVCHPSW